MSKLGVIFTRNVSLKIWINLGLFEREKLLFEKQLDSGEYEEIYWFTYGRSDAIIGEKLQLEGKLHKKIKIIPMPKIFYTELGGNIYSLLMPFIKKRYFITLDLIKSSQLDGSWVGAIVKKIYKIPFLLRTGYTYTKLSEEHLKIEKGVKRLRRKLDIFIYTMIEKKLYNQSNRIIVTSVGDKEYICTKYGIEHNKVEIIPNFIETSQFFYDNKVIRQNRCVFVGRLNPIKNIENLIKAAEKIGMGLDIYGKGELEENLKKLVSDGVDIRFKGGVANSELNSILNKYEYFALVSFTEGMPKSLIEAMACGTICIGTDVKGIREIITDNYTGFLARGTDAEEIERAIIRAVQAKNKEEIRINQLRLVEKTFSLSAIVKLENRLEIELLKNR